MAWIKRNLFFVIGLIVAALLLAAAVVYDLKSLDDNTQKTHALDEIYDTFGNTNKDSIYISLDNKPDNIQAARNQAAEIRVWRNTAENYFTPVTPIPNRRRVTSEAFAAELSRTIFQLQTEAAAAGVELPPKYAFSFDEERSTVRFQPDSLEPLALQLGEVKAISEILFEAHINSLEVDGVQRARVSQDDATGPQADYVSDAAVTNKLAILTPYAVTFRSFSGELAAVLAAFASSPHGFIVKGISVSPVAEAAPAGANGQPQAAPGRLAPAGGRGGLPTMLNEKLLRITLEIEIVKLQ